MAKTERILAIDVGAAALKVGEFEATPDGGMCLMQYTYHEYDETLTDKSRSQEVAGVLRQIIQEKGYQARKAIIGLSGQFAIVRFVKLPPMMKTERIRQMVEYEVRQNIHFPIEEATWDYQLFTREDSAEVDAILAMVRNEIVEEIIKTLDKEKIKAILTDVSMVACYNAARINYIGDENCELIIDIGGCNTNLIFVDGNNFFSRSVPIGGYTITQQISKDFGVSMAQAEEIKRRHAFVSLGGNYAEAPSEVAAKVSKIVRNVMTRLHTEIVRSINAYRSIQQGRKPVRAYLTGGSSTMMYTDNFFVEKLQMEVVYLNPFQAIVLDDSINRESFQEVAHMFAGVIGLGMRHFISCPVELSLVPESQRLQSDFSHRKPWLMAAASILSLLPLLYWGGEMSRLGGIHAINEKLGRILSANKKTESDIKGQLDKAAKSKSDLTEVMALVQERGKLNNVYRELAKANMPYIWVNRMDPLEDSVKEINAPELTPGGGGGGGMSIGGEAAPGTEKKVVVKGFLLQGYYLDGLTEEKVVPIADAAAAGGAAAPAPAPAPDAGAPADAAAAGAPTGPVRRLGLLDQYCQRLCECTPVDPDPKYTGLVGSGVVQGKCKNLWFFKIQVKLKDADAINLSRYSASASQSEKDGAGGRMGGPF